MLRLFLLFWVFLTWHARAFDDDFHLKLLPIPPEIEAASAKALQGCEPPQQGQVVGAINKNNVYTLTGDVFITGIPIASSMTMLMSLFVNGSRSLGSQFQ